MKNRVKELREAKHLTQTGLALKVGSTQQTISKIEREIGVPKLDLALIMADFFNVTLEYMFKTNYSDHSQNSETISRVWNKKIGLYELAC